MNKVNFKIGDLIKLRGFKKLDINETPVGIIVANLGLGKYKVNWTDTIIAKRFALTEIMDEESMDLIN